MTVHRVKVCTCGHEESWHGTDGVCAYGHGHAMGGCTCAKFSRRKRGASPTSKTSTPKANGLLHAIDETIAALTKLRAELAAPMSNGMTAIIGPLPDVPSLPAPPGWPTSKPVIIKVPTNGKRVRFAGLDSGKTMTLKRLPGLGRCERAILTVLAQHGPRTKSQIGILAGYSSKSGGFRNALSTLRTGRFIYDSDGRLAITTDGHQVLGDVEKLPRGRDLLEYWKANAGGLCERTILDVLAAAYPQRLPKDRIAAETARFRDDGEPYSASSGGFRNALSRLRTLELVNGKSELSLASTLAEAS